MTREEEINTAVSRYIEENTINGYVTISGHKDSFIEGVEWADSHPKPLWVSVADDLPCNHEELSHSVYSNITSYVVALRRGDVYLSKMRKLNGKWQWETYEPTHWFPIPKLPKDQMLRFMNKIYKN